MQRYAGTRAVFLADGDPPSLGETFRQPDLARTLSKLAHEGNDGFYRGDVAQKLLADVRRYGGDWSQRDFDAYRVKERAPIRIRYRDYEIVTAPPPSSGGVVLAEILQVLEGWDLAKLPEDQRVHLMVEAMRRAYRDRGLYLGDPDFVQMPIARLTSDDYAAGLRAAINPDKATPSASLPSGSAPFDGVNTTHFSVIDAEGNLAAVTQTVNLGYGSGMVAEGTGVILNNEMDDFALRPGTPNAFGVIGFDANAVAPGRRPLSSMSPSFMIGRDRVAVLGAKGGSRIITITLAGMLGLERGMSPAQIAAMPRFHHQYLPDRITAEPGALSPDTIAKLQAMGHEVKVEAEAWPFYLHVVDWNLRDGALRGGADPRNPPGAATISRPRPAAQRKAKAEAEVQP
jgi:gamma-glutamyltranspeptidase/glutathione hydrolase